MAKKQNQNFHPEGNHANDEFQFRCMVCGDENSDLLFSQEAWAREHKYVTVCKLCHEDISRIEGTEKIATTDIYEFKSIHRRFSFAGSKISVSVLKRRKQTFMLTYDKAGNFSDCFELGPDVILNHGTFMEN
jgi:hypothetical protein